MMELKTALEIIIEQAKYVDSITGSTSDYVDSTEYEKDPIKAYEYLYSENGDAVVESIPGNYQLEKWKFDQEKLHVSLQESYGGEGKGDEYWYVFKIKHPVHGEGFIRYVGYYDSWNGTEWEGTPARMVKPVQKTITVYE
jgi:hypothetical protein